MVTEGKERPHVHSNPLKQVSLRILDSSTCADKVDGYRYGVVITDEMICTAADVSGQGTCQVCDILLFLKYKELDIK